MIVYLDEILEVSASSNFYLNIEKTKPNSLFIPNDPSFSISEANSKCLTFYLNENNFYLNVHPLYFSEEFPIDFFNSLIKQYQELTTEIQDKNFLIINTIKELNDNKKYKELNQYLDENKSDISSFYLQNL